MVESPALTQLISFSAFSKLLEAWINEGIKFIYDGTPYSSTWITINSKRRWDGMGWDGMGWDGMGWDGMGWDGRGKRLLPERASSPLGTTHAVLTTPAARTPTSPTILSLVSTPHPGQGLHFGLFSSSSGPRPPGHTYAFLNAISSASLMACGNHPARWIIPPPHSISLSDSLVDDGGREASRWAKQEKKGRNRHRYIDI